MMKVRNLILANVASAAIASSSFAAVIAQFNFNSVPADASTSTGSVLPSTGVATVTPIGLANNTPAFAAGSPGDPAATDNTGLALTGFAAQGTNSGTAGFQVNASTLLATGISIGFDFRESGTASRFFQLQLSANGTTFTNASGGTASFGTVNNNTNTSFTSAGLYSNTSSSGTQAFVQGLSYVLPVGSVYENDPNFAFRFVAVFDPSSAAPGSYISSNTGTVVDYGGTGGGTARVDLATVSGTVTPEPATIGLLGLSGAGLLMRRRKA